MNRASRLMDGIGTFVVASLLCLVLFVLVAPCFGFLFVAIMGDSMSPALPFGSLALVQRVASSDIHVGDVITYRPEDGGNPLVTHRVTEVLSQQGSVSFQTTGDGNEVPDKNPVASNGVVGRVRCHVPFVGFILNLARQPVVNGLLMGLPAIAIVVVMVRGTADQRQSFNKEDRQEVP